MKKLLSNRKKVNLLSIEDLTNKEIMKLIKKALKYKNRPSVIKNKFNNLFVSNLFFENSTRTKLSFEVAQKKLGINVINFEVDNSSIQKGETLYDTCKTLESIGVNLLVIRHNKEKYFDELKNINIPIINSGDGSGEHPTQSLLDLMTIYEHFKKFKGLKVAIIGDIKNSRVAKSNFKALTSLGAKVYFVSPNEFIDEKYNNYYQLDNLINDIDVCMLLRVQHERHLISNNNYEFLKKYNQEYGLNSKRYSQLKKNAIIMHPAPFNRNVEIDDEIIESPKSKIFEQMKNGMFMRQAVLEYIIHKNKII